MPPKKRKAGALGAEDDEKRDNSASIVRALVFESGRSSLEDAFMKAFAAPDKAAFFSLESLTQLLGRPPLLPENTVASAAVSDVTTAAS